MDPQHPHPHPHPPQPPPKTPLTMRRRSSNSSSSSSNPELLIRVMQQSRPTHTNHPNLDMDSNQIMLPHTTKDKARVGPLPRMHMHNKDKDKDKKRIMPVHSRDTHIHHSSQLRPLRCTRRLNQGIMDILTGIFWCIAKAHTVPPTRTTQQTDVVSRNLDGEIAKIAVSLTIWPIQRTQQIHHHRLMTPGAVVKTSSPQEPWCSVFFFVFPRLDVVDFRWPLFLFRRCQRSATSSPVSLVINLEIP